MKIKNLRTRILLSFYILAIIPAVIISVISLNNTVNILENNFNAMTEVNLEQVNKRVSMTFENYQDLLYQLYIDDNVVELVKDINDGENMALSKSQLLRKVREAANVKPYIESVMIIPKQGNPIFFDKLTAASMRSAWMDSYPVDIKEMYEEVSGVNQTIVYPTEYAITIVGEEYYLFHSAHRIIDYHDVNEELGIVIFSFNYKMLDSICNEENVRDSKTFDSINFLVDSNGELMSFPVAEYIDEELKWRTKKGGYEKEVYQKFIDKTKLFKDRPVLINYTKDEQTGWTIVDITDKDILTQKITVQRKWILLIILISIPILVLMGYFLTNQLTSSINKVVSAIKNVSKDKLSAKITIDKNMPEEIKNISVQFNNMLDKLEVSLNNERAATAKQRNAEIAFLEAQINPHFLYNTLDTINWMAIDEEQYEISDAVNSLAKILRYGISESTKSVPVSHEIEWLKQYIFLQQYRVKSMLQCNISVEPEVMNCYIHKLLLQPFVENAIKHGFEKDKENFLLEITIQEYKNKIIITIQDNGKGIEQDKQDQLLGAMTEENGQHIGVRNVMERIKIYYGDEATVKLESKEDIGTTVTIQLPRLIK